MFERMPLLSWASTFAHDKGATSVLTVLLISIAVALALATVSTVHAATKSRVIVERSGDSFE